MFAPWYLRPGRRLRQRLTSYGLLVLPGGLILAPVLFFGRAFADGDAVLQLYPAFGFLKATLARGDSLLWNPHVLSGFVTAASLMGGWLSFVHQLAVQSFSVFTAYAWLTWLYFSLTAFFTYALVRALGLPRFCALFAGLVAPWVTASAAWAANMTMTPSFFLLPALLYFFLQFSRCRWLANVFIALAAGLLVGTAWHAAHVQMAVQAVTASLAWALWLDWRQRKFQVLPFALLTLLVSAAVAWPQYALVLFAKNFSARVHQGISLAEAQSGALLPGDLLSLLLPTLHLPGVIAYPGVLYTGALPPLLFLISWLGKKTAEYKFFGWLLAITTLASIKYSPVLWLVHQLPLFQPFRGLVRLMHLGLFALVVLAAYGLAYLQQGQPVASAEDRRLRAVVTWAWRAALAVVALFAVWSMAWTHTSRVITQAARRYFAAVYRPSDLTLPREHYDQVIDAIVSALGRDTTYPNRPVTVAVVALVLGTGGLVLLRRSGSRQLVFVVIAVAALNLVVINAASLQTVSVAQLQAPPLPVEFFRVHERQDFRVFTAFAGFTTFDRLDTPYGYDPVHNVELLKNLLSPNLGMLYGVDVLDTYDNLMDERHSRMLAYLGSDRSLQPTGKLSALDLDFTEKIKLLLDRISLLSALNVKYLISAYPLQHAALRPVVRWEATDYRLPLILYENLNVRPRYYLVGDPRLRPPLTEEQSWQAMLTAVNAGQTIVECVGCPRTQPGSGTVTMIRKSNASYEFAVTTSAPQYFIFGQNFLPGWRAAVDGTAAPVFRANYVNLAVAVPPGNHHVNLNFSVPSIGRRR